MPDQRIVTVDGKPQYFPADATDAEISAALSAIPASNASHAPKARTWTDVAVDALPAVLGTAGAVAGGAGGAAFGVGFGGVPGAAGGATLGTGAGEALRQLINRSRGVESPSTPGEAAADIAVPALKAGATTAVLGGGVKAAGMAGKALVKGAMKTAGMVNPDLVAVASPRIGSAIKVINQVKAAATQPPAAVEKVAEKLSFTADDVLRYQQLVKNGIPKGVALRTIINLKATGQP